MNRDHNADYEGRLHDKYLVERRDGRENPNARYFVLDYVNDPHARKALSAYAESVHKENYDLACDLRGALIETVRRRPVVAKDTTAGREESSTGTPGWPLGVSVGQTAENKVEHHCPTCDISRAMRRIRESLDAIDDCHDAWLNDSEEAAMGAAEYERIKDDLTLLRKWVQLRMHRSFFPWRYRLWADMERRINLIIGGRYGAIATPRDDEGHSEGA